MSPANPDHAAASSPDRRRHPAEPDGLARDTIGAPVAIHNRVGPGELLPAGFHWDVELKRKRGTTHLMTSHEVWRIKSKQYLNVYPDMNVRATRAGGRKHWPNNKNQ